MGRKNQLILTLITLAINYSLDRTTKLLAINYLEEKGIISFFHHTIVLQYAENTGAFLSTGSDWPDIVKYITLVIIPILACLYGLYYCAFKLGNRKLIIVIVSIIGGGLGNLIDRLINNFRVVDFLNFGIGPLRTGILNIADMSVTFGILFLIFYRIKGHNLNAKARE